MHVSAGVLVGIIGAMAAFGAYAFARRYGGGAALSQLEMANRVLTRRVGELQDDNRRLSAEVADLRARTDIAIALVPLLDSLDAHEGRAAERSLAHVAVLTEILAAVRGRDGV